MPGSHSVAWAAVLLPLSRTPCFIQRHYHMFPMAWRNLDLSILFCSRSELHLSGFPMSLKTLAHRSCRLGGPWILLALKIVRAMCRAFWQALWTAFLNERITLRFANFLHVTSQFVSTFVRIEWIKRQVRSVKVTFNIPATSICYALEWEVTFKVSGVVGCLKACF
jgi:hypothetical protein